MNAENIILIKIGIKNWINIKKHNIILLNKICTKLDINKRIINDE